MRRALAGLALGLVALVALAAPAAAHAQLVSTTPSSGATLDDAPGEAVVRFNEGVEAGGDAVQVHDASGERVPTDGLERVDGGRTLRLPLPDLDDGGYVLSWRVVSLDGHPISGGVTWRVGADAEAVDPSLFEEILNADSGDALVSGAAALVRALLFAGLLGLVGTLAFLALVWPDGTASRGVRQLLRGSLVVAAVATVVGIGVQGADVAGSGLASAVDPGTFGDTIETSYGKWALIRLLPLAVLAALAWSPAAVRATWWRVTALVAAAAAFTTLGLAGHARTGRWVGLAVPVDVVHLLAAAVWIGGLVVLVLVVLPRDDDHASAVAARFSTVAAWAVGAVVVTGVVQGFRQLEAVDGLRETNYGRLLVLKVAAVALLAVLGALSRSLVRSRLVDDPSDPSDPADVRRALRRSVGAEALIAVAVLALTSLLVAADPSRTASEDGFAATRVVQSTLLEVFVAPARTGPVDVHVYASDPTFGLTPDLEATATLTLPDRDIPPVQVPIRYAGRGHWSAYDFDLPIAGRWRLDVALTVGKFDQRTATFFVPID